MLSGGARRVPRASRKDWGRVGAAHTVHASDEARQVVGDRAVPHALVGDEPFGKLLREVANLAPTEKGEEQQLPLRDLVEASHPPVEFEQALRVVLGRRADDRGATALARKDGASMANVGVQFAL